MDRLTIPSPLGPLTLTAVDGRLTALDWQHTGTSDAGALSLHPAWAAPLEPVMGVRGQEAPPGCGAASRRLQVPLESALAAAAEQLAAYFGGQLTAFDLPLAPAGTPFQQLVWQAMRMIPFGSAASYGGLARQLGSSARAVGRACARNPLPIVIPCHRVLASGGALGGYSGGTGLETKRWLLRHEGFAGAPPLDRGPAQCSGLDDNKRHVG